MFTIAHSPVGMVYRQGPGQGMSRAEYLCRLTAHWTSGLPGGGPRNQSPAEASVARTCLGGPGRSAPAGKGTAPASPQKTIAQWRRPWKIAPPPREHRVLDPRCQRTGHQMGDSFRWRLARAVACCGQRRQGRLAKRPGINCGLGCEAPGCGSLLPHAKVSSPSTAAIAEIIGPWYHLLIRHLASFDY
jgi:hypothetical protein